MTTHAKTKTKKTDFLSTITSTPYEDHMKSELLTTQTDLVAALSTIKRLRVVLGLAIVTLLSILVRLYI